MVTLLLGAVIGLVASRIHPVDYVLDIVEEAIKDIIKQFTDK